MAEIASAFISILPSMRGFGSKLESEVGGEVEKSGRSLGSRFGGALGTAAKVGLLAGGVAIAAFAKSSIGAASDAQQSIGATETVFGRFANTVIRSSKAAATQYGLDANTYRENANVIGSLFKNQGVAVEELAGKTKSMIGVAADLSATFGGSTTEAVEALSSAFKGEFDPLERYGISLKQSSINALLAARGQDKLTGAALKQAQQVATTDLIMKQSAQTRGAFAKESDTLAHQQQVLAAQFENIKATVGSALLPVLTSLAATVSGKILPAVQGFIEQMRSGQGAGGALASALGTIGSVLGTVAGVVNQNRTVFATFLGVLAGFQIIRSITASVMAFNVALAANPIGLVVVALAALAAGLVYAYKHSETFRTIVNGAFTAIKAVAAPVLNWLKTAVATTINFVRDHWRLIITIIGGPLGLAVALVTKHWNTIKAATTAAWNAIKTVVSTQINAAKTVVNVAISAIRGYFNLIGAIVGKVREWFTAIVNAVRDKLGEAVGIVRDFPGRVTAALGNIGSALYGKGRELVQGLINGIKSMAGSILSAIKSIIPHVPGLHIPGLARGGPVASGRTYLVGENGPELFTSSRSGYIVPNHRLSVAGASSGVSDQRVVDLLERLVDVAGRQGREFGRELNGATAAGARRRVAV